MKELKVNHVYLAKHLPVRNSMSFFSTQVVEKVKDVQRIVVKEEGKCYPQMVRRECSGWRG